MNYRYGLFIPIICCLAACNTNKAKTDENSEAPEGIHCYRYASNRDTVDLKIDVAGNSVTGNLVYKIFEKDQNAGSIKGHFRGDTLFADYTFQSEGIQSVRELAFLRRGNDLVEGYGEVEETNSGMRFKNLQSLSFGEMILLRKVCDN
jgi:hypothetical protein